ncbi:MAG: hypothetical protein JWO38_6399 [Gemmataceae bacterium]|nr:hypothetical protein [Gemmataceae bacterium]
MLQEILSAVTAAEGLVDQITGRFGRGDAADDLRRDLAARVAEIKQRTADVDGPLPDDVQAAVARLLARIQSATTSGEVWLERAEADLAPQAARERVRRVYGLRPRDP